MHTHAHTHIITQNLEATGQVGVWLEECKAGCKASAALKFRGSPSTVEAPPNPPQALTGCAEALGEGEGEGDGGRGRLAGRMLPLNRPARCEGALTSAGAVGIYGDRQYHPSEDTWVTGVYSP